MKLTMNGIKVVVEFRVLNPNQIAMPTPSTDDLIADLLCVIRQIEGVESTVVRYYERNNVVVSLVCTHNLEGIIEALEALSEVF